MKLATADNRSVEGPGFCPETSGALRVFTTYPIERMPESRNPPDQITPVASPPDRSFAFDAELLALLPTLRAYARSLCRNSTLADDLVQETAASAIAKADSYASGSNMRAWLFTILRNHFFSTLRRHHREVEDVGGLYADGVPTRPVQNACVDLSDTMHAISELSEDHRDALMLLAGDGLSYEAAATRSACAVGTIKSRVHRARGRLAELLAARRGGSGVLDARIEAPRSCPPQKHSASA